MSDARGVLVRFREDSRNPLRALAVAMMAAAVAILAFGHGATFSGDELVIVTSSPGIDLDTIFHPHGGHLIALPRLVYRVTLEVFGLGYLPYRVLAVAAILLSVGLFFAWARRRVDPWLALLACLPLLFFGADYMHMFQGNGFIVLMSVAFGLAALLALERESRRGDLLVALFLVLGLLTYSVALAFLAAALFLLLAGRQWGRLWVVLVPLGLYLLWRLWLVAADVPSNGGGLDYSALLLVPAWSFQSLAGVLSALSGLDYSFGGPAPESVGPAGAPLAILAGVLLFYAVRRGGFTRQLAMACFLALALWTMQALAAGDAAGLRIPGLDTRYLYPGAFVVAMVGIAAVGHRHLPNGLLAFVAIVALSAVSVNLMVMKDGSAKIRESGDRVTSLVGMYRMLGLKPGGSGSSSDSSIGALVAMTATPYGDFGDSVGQLEAMPEGKRQEYDRLMAAIGGAGLVPAAAAPTACRPAGSQGVRVIPGTSVTVVAPGGKLTARRLGDAASASLGEPAAGSRVTVTLPGSGEPPWWLGAGTAIKVCEEK